MRKKIISLILICSIVASISMLFTGCGRNNKLSAVDPLWAAGSERNKIVIISDIHLGIDDRYSEIILNRPFLIEFLQRLQHTDDVSELVIAGDFLDDWYLPVFYPSHSDPVKFFKDCIANNQEVIDELNNLISAGIKVVYVPGNHDLLLESEVLQEAVPGIVQARDTEGLGAYYTGKNKEIVIEHSHRYDVFSAPDTLTNAELCGNEDTILPAGYFYARYAATWVLEDSPKLERTLPIVTNIPDKTDIDQYGAYVYYSIIKNISGHLTIKEGLEEEVFDIRIAGFNDKYTFLDFYPSEQEDGTISAVLFRNIQRTWSERQALNLVKKPSSFIEATAGALKWTYFFEQAKTQYLDNPDENVNIVVFGHTHIPAIRSVGDDKYYVNSGTWVDHSNVFEGPSRHFAVITVSENNAVALYSYGRDSTINDMGQGVSDKP
ncbi:MAG TPA: metallophosphoesterase [Clostridia bacterium]|nr:metallophosphoesterase [Clostridia bacterium]HQO70360.1 metallophosphoesterase [Clostridia bacterium]